MRVDILGGRREVCSLIKNLIICSLVELGEKNFMLKKSFSLMDEKERKTVAVDILENVYEEE